MLPTIRIRNISGDVHSKSLVQRLESQLGEKENSFFFAGVRVTFTQTNAEGKKDCLIAFPARWKAETLLTHSLKNGFTLESERLDIAFDFSYLRSCVPKDWRP